MELLAAIEQSAPGSFMRLSRWGYPLVNVLHVLGLAALYGAVLVADLRMLRGPVGATGSDPAAAAALRVAAGGLAVAAASGLLLASARATEYADMPVFLWKIGFVALGLANALAARALGLDRHRPRLVAVVSLGAWTAAVVLGRLIGYAEG